MNWKALLGPATAVLGFVLSPDFINVLPDKAAHIVTLAAVLVSTMAPQLVQKKDK